MAILRQTLAGLRVLLVLTVVCGIAYPLLVTGLARTMPGRADGSLVRRDGQVVGSSLIGQAATDPRWFQARPSETDNDGASSGGSNLALGSPELASKIAERKAALLKANPDARGPIPADALTASFSGLDADISPAYAHWQAPRVAKARGITLQRVDELVDRTTSGRDAGLLGQARVNTVRLNQALDQLHG